MKRILAFAFSLLFTATIFASDTVKKSSSGICHSVESPYYNRVKNFTPYSDISGCLNSGGRLPKGYSSNSNPSRNTKATTGGYSREQFGRGWADTDGDCQNSRHEALIAQSTGQVRFKTGRECQVTAGRWISPFTGAVIHDPSQIDIDHVVPLKWAWEHGANQWPKAKREKFANDPVNLLSVEASLNRQKGAKGLSEWLPPASRCEYASRFIRVAKSYGLQVPKRYLNIQEQVCH